MDQKSKEQIAADLAAEYRQAIRRTAEEDQRIRKRGYLAAASKSMGVAYFLWAVLGTCGAHRFYLGYYPTATAMLTLSLFGGLFAFLPGLGVFSVPLLALLSFWWLVDAFMIPRMMPDQPVY